MCSITRMASCWKKGLSMVWRGSIIAVVSRYHEIFPEFVGCLMFGGLASCLTCWGVVLFVFLVWYGGFLFMFVVVVVW